MQSHIERFMSVRARSETLAAPLSAEDMVVQSMPDVSPTKWHLGHTTWFFETFILKPKQPGYKVFDPAYNYLFNSYYNAIGERHPRPKRGLLTRPPLSEVMAYRVHVTETVADWLTHKDDAGILKLIELGCNHEEQHQELILTDIKHVLSCNPLKPPYYRVPPPKMEKAKPLSFSNFEEGIREIGHNGEGFAFDCEGPRHKVFMQAFQLASRPATNGEYLNFVEAGGYSNPEFWLSEGWAHISENHITCPAYWQENKKGREEFTLYGQLPLDPDAPVCHLSFYEADAFARWSEARLPTEAELEVAADGPGDVWQWTSSSYGPYPGFRAAKGAVGEYNGKFMVGQMVLRGGSRATPPGHWRPTYRNFFYPPDTWQFTGVRLARDL